MTEMQRSALLEVGNVGSGHAARALSKLMNRTILITVPSVEVVDLVSIEGILESVGDELVRISLMVRGDAKGVIFFIIRKNRAEDLCDIVMNRSCGSSAPMGEMEFSALNEIGNIIMSSYLNAVGGMTGLSLIVTTPECHVGKVWDMNAILEGKNVRVDEGIDALCVKTDLIDEETRLEGYLVFVPLEGALAKILNSLGM